MPEYSTNTDKRCLLCGNVRFSGDKFCSRECKSKSQKLKVNYNCAGCGQLFQNWPCMKRKSNYCSIKCYWNSTRRKEKRICKVCSKSFIATKTQIKNGFGIYCSRECQHKTYPDQIKKVCPMCTRIYFVPPSWAPKRKFCSKKCQDDSMRDYVTKVCKKCSKSFEMPRSELNRGFGRGSFCSFECHMHFRGESSLEEMMKVSLDKINVSYQREVKFKRFRVDFLIEKYKTVIECDGEFWHLRPNVKARDKRKDILLQSLGYRVLRFTGNELDKLDENKLSKILLEKL